MPPLEPGEIQILAGPGLTVTNRRVTFAGGEIAVGDIAGCTLRQTTRRVSAMPTVLAIGTVIFALGALLGVPFVWIVGGAVMAWAPFAKIRQPAFTLALETSAGEREVYYARSERDGRMAAAAVEEARRQL